MKKILKVFCIVSIFITLLMFSTVFAANVDVQINGEIIDFTDSEGNKVNAQIINDRTMVPLRKIFEVLGCDIGWENSTRTVTANKDNKEIILQINNNVATIKENGKEKKIILDTAPMIIDSRTLVPLRFIAESLGKQVGWDKSSYTAIIIDYDYFSKLIGQKNNNLYNILSTTDNNVSFSITRNYIDKLNSSNNDSATIKGSTTYNNELSNVILNFEGNNELIKEIIKEGWNNIVFDAKYDKNMVTIDTTNTTLNKILNLTPDNTNNVSKLSLVGNFEDSLGSAIQNIFNIKESDLNVSTFNKMKTDFNTFLNLFIVNGTRNLNFNNSKLEIFDYTRFDNIVYGNELSRVLSFINKKIFNYDVIQDELLYDWSNINYNMNCENNNLILKIVLENEYNEKIEYIITYKLV